MLGDGRVAEFDGCSRRKPRASTTIARWTLPGETNRAGIALLERAILAFVGCERRPIATPISSSTASIPMHTRPTGGALDHDHRADRASAVTRRKATSRIVSLCIDANDPPRMAQFWADALGWKISESDGEAALIPDRRHRLRDPLRADLGEQDRSEQHPSRPDDDIDRRSTRHRRPVDRSRRPARGHRAAWGRRSCRARRSRGQRVLHHRSVQHLPRRAAHVSEPSTPTGRARSASSGARHSVGP